MNGLRVVSLVPSVTETLLGWGVEVVACTRFCEQPQLLHVGGTKDPDIEAIAALTPDLVVLDEEENRLPDAEALTALGLPLHVTHVTRLDDVPATLTALAAAVGADVPPIELPAPWPRGSDACVLIWRRPWMTINADTYGSTVLEHLGTGNVFAGAVDRYPVVTIDEIAARAPQLVMLPTEPYAFKERHVVELRAALPAADVRLIDGTDLFWWGSRTPGALARLAAALA